MRLPWLLLPIAAAVACLASPALGAPISYDKVIYFNGSAASAEAAALQSIKAGASVNTAFFPTIKVTLPSMSVTANGKTANVGAATIEGLGAPTPTVAPPGMSLMFGGAEYPFPNEWPDVSSADPLPTIAAPATVATGLKPDPAEINYKDNRVNPSSAKAKLTVDPWQAEGEKVKAIINKNPKGTFTPTNFTRATLSGSAIAGLPKFPPDAIHAAMSIAGVQVAGTPFKIGTPGDVVRDAAQRVGGGIAGGVGSTAIGGGRTGGRVSDPLYMVVMDVTDPGNVFATAAQEIMEEILTATGRGSVNVDDTGITLAVDLTDPDASASISFATIGSWVVNPYAYGGTLTPDGFAGSGIMPTSEWSVSTSGDVQTAFLSWISFTGSTGIPFDVASIMPDASAFPNPDGTYQYELGDIAGAFDIAIAPEPGTLGLFAGGLAGLLGYGWRRRRRAT